MAAAKWRRAAVSGAQPVVRGLHAERDRWLLWSPVAIGLGIYCYFSLLQEPGWPLPVIAIAGGLIALFLVRRRPLAVFALLMMCLGGIGFLAGVVRTSIVDAPALSRKLGPVSVTGHIVSVERRRHGARLVLDRLSIDRVDRAATPVRIRVTARIGWVPLRPGQIVTARVVLLPVRPPVAPGAMDFQRRAYFQQIGASGFVVTAPQIVRDALPGEIASWVEQIRDAVARRISQSLSGDTGAVAKALLTGHRGEISKETMSAIRASGLAHLLAISGLHVGMVGGVTFFFLWFALALFPGAALRWPTRRIAAVVTLVVAFLYVLLTGATIPTQRAFIMLAIVMAGVLFGRVAISMRLVAIAAAALLLLMPESLLSPSFQMSFAAVVALVAAYEAWTRYRQRHPNGVRRNRLVRGVVGISATSLIAGAATGPFALLHFQRLAVYGLLANLAAVPIVSFFVLPMGLLALLAMPLGLEEGPLWLMGAGIDAMLWVAAAVAGLPGALALAPAPTSWGIALIVAGGLWLAIWQSRWRLFGSIAVAIGLSSSLFVLRPDILVSPTGRLSATRTIDGSLAVSSARRGRFIARVWREAEAQRRSRYWRKDRLSAVRCDAEGCIYRVDGRLVAFPETPAALAEDCRRAFVVVTNLETGERCHRVRWLIDRRALRQRGSHALWIQGDSVRIRTDHDVRGRRPWVTRPPLRVRRLRLARKR